MNHLLDIIKYVVQARQRSNKFKRLSSATSGDDVFAFDEISAAEGCLGRFPGSQVLSVIKEMASA